MMQSTAEFHRAQGQEAPGGLAIPPENNAPLVVYLLSDLAKSVHGQVVRVQGRSISLMTHPAALQPGVERDQWTVKDVAAAFDTQLAALQLPLGVQSYEVKVGAYKVPYARTGDTQENISGRGK
jgi:hypothetical protein